MTTLFETLTAKKHSAPEGGEHRKSEHKGGKEHRKEKEDGKEGKEKNKEKSKFKYPEMKLEDVKAKEAGGYKFKSATEDDYKDKSKEKNIVSIKLPKSGVIPFLMIPPVDATNSDDGKTHKPMDIKGDPEAKDKVESAFDPKALNKKMLELGKHHMKALITNKPEDHKEYGKHSQSMKEAIDESEKDEPNRKQYHGNMRNAVRMMDSLHTIDKDGNKKPSNTK